MNARGRNGADLANSWLSFSKRSLLHSSFLSVSLSLSFSLSLSPEFEFIRDGTNVARGARSSAPS